MRRSHRWQLFTAGLGFLLASGAILFSVAQLPVVREFFSSASGEPANLVIDTEAIIGPMPRPWRNLAQGGEDHAWRLQPLQGSVAALKPRYVRLDHVYDFYDIVGGGPGNLTFDFSKFDLILNDILATGAKPYIALSYMPPAISSGDIVAPPVNWADWQLTVQKTIQHVSGTRNIPDVYYEVWNEPDLFGGWKYYGARNYLDLYTYAARGAERARPTVRQPFKIGGPAITALYKNWFDALLKHTAENNLPLDFFSWHRYTTDIEQYKTDMIEARTWLSAHPRYDGLLELHITEWGHDSNNNAGYDTSYGAAHTVAGSIEMVGTIDNAFVFEIQDGKDPEGKASWGRWGLFQHADVGAAPKPRYRALRMLDQVGEQRLQLLGKGTWVKALAGRDDTGATTVVLSNYDPKGRNSENVPITFQNIVPGSYTVTKQYLNGQQLTENVATDAAELRIVLPMRTQDVAIVKLRVATPTP